MPAVALPQRPGDEPLEAFDRVGGGEMNRATSSVVSSAKSDGASDGAQLAQRDLRAGQHRQAARASRC